MQAKFALAYWPCLAQLVVLALSASCPAQSSLRLGDLHGDAERLEQALAQRGSLIVHETALTEVMDKLSAQFQAPIVLVPKKLEEAGVNLDTPVNKHLESLPLESILRLVLKELDLDFTIRNSVILVTTPEDLESPSMMDMRIYPVRDLVARRIPRASDDARSRVEDYDSLIDLIQTTAAPESWVDVGGPGSIMEFENSGAIVVSHTRSVHREIEQLLAALRKVKQYQGISSLPLPKKVSTRIAGRTAARPARRVPAVAAQSWQVPQTYAEE